MTGEIKKLPLYRNAVEKFMAMNPQPGFVLPDEWLEIELELNFKIANYEEYQNANAVLMSQVGHFIRSLMIWHQVHLARANGTGYRVLSPEEVTPLEMADLQGDLARRTRRADRRLAFVPLNTLTDDQRRDHADAVTRVAQLRAFAQATFQLPPVPRLGGTGGN